MFEWFNKTFSRRDYIKDDRTDMEKIADDMKKVIPFPEPKESPKMPEVVPPKEKPAVTYYRLGLTDNNRVSLQMGYSEITMNSAGIDNLIKQLEVFRDQLHEDTDEE